MKTVDMKDPAYFLKEWLREAERGGTASVFAHLPSKTKELLRRVEANPEARLSSADARSFVKAMRDRLKNVGKYGGIPSQMAEERKRLQEMIEETTFAIKHAAPDEPARGVIALR